MLLTPRDPQTKPWALRIKTLPPLPFHLPRAEIGWRGRGRTEKNVHLNLFFFFFSCLTTSPQNHCQPFSMACPCPRVFILFLCVRRERERERVKGALESLCHFLGLPQSFPVKYLQALKLQLRSSAGSSFAWKRAPAAGRNVASPIWGGIISMNKNFLQTVDAL